MPQAGLIYRVLVASPSDCLLERKVIPEVMQLWNTLHSYRLAAIIEPVLWETHSRPELGDRPQELLNKQIVDRCDILVGAFWTRLGTDTGRAESGTLEEIAKFRAAGKPVLLYFSSMPVVPESVDPEQYQRLREYFAKVRHEGIVASYETIQVLREQLLRHLNDTVTELHKKTDFGVPTPPLPPTSETDDKRVFRLLKSNFAAFVRRVEAEWSSERDGGPYSTDDGRYIMRSALTEAQDFRSQIDNARHSNVADLLADAIKRLKAVERDAESPSKFWRSGDHAIAALQRANDALQER